MNHIQIARIAFECTRQLTIELDHEVPATWNDLPRQEQLRIASSVENMLRDPSLTSAAMHADRVKHLKAHGWVHGEKLDEDQRTDPWLVPYEQTNPEYQALGGMIEAVVNQLRPLYALRALEVEAA